MKGFGDFHFRFPKRLVCVNSALLIFEFPKLAFS